MHSDSSSAFDILRVVFKEKKIPYNLFITSAEWVKRPVSMNTVIHVLQIV